jgi:hypothetical protein
MDPNQSITDAQLQELKARISKEVNPQNKTEAIKLLADSKLIERKLENAADNFVKQVGRNMTYSEIREMMG